MFHLLQESWPHLCGSISAFEPFFILNRCSDAGLISAGKLNIHNFNPIALSYLRNLRFPTFIFNCFRKNDTLHITIGMEADYLLLPFGEFNYNLFNTGKSRGFETVLVDHPKLATQLKTMQEQKWILYINTTQFCMKYTKTQTLFS